MTIGKGNIAKGSEDTEVRFILGSQIFSDLRLKVKCILSQ